MTNLLCCNRILPPLPEKRKYSVQAGGLKVYFPRIRVMREGAYGEYQLVKLESYPILTYIMARL